MRHTYPSDITREQFDTISALLEENKKKTRPRTVDPYAVFCAVLYTLKTGCQWSALPHDFPARSTVHRYFTAWSKERKSGRKTQPSPLEEVLKKISWRGSYQQWSDRKDQQDHRWCPKCQKHWYRKRKRLWRRQESLRYQAPHRSRYQWSPAYYYSDHGKRDRP